ncbi:MAG: threonine/serine dehydratase, partial [Vallitaleaceae bacterium]|nr:threonine/serine dehydratase [Vallitaleaceae bacterium]
MDLSTIIKAREHLKHTIRHTELLHSAFFSSESGNDVYIKPENLQETGSFKLRGAYNKIYQLNESGDINGLVASSAGNHAQGVAFSAKELSVPAHIVMPITTPLIKVEATRQYGVEVILKGHDYQEAYEYALKLKEEKGYTFIHPFDDLDVIAGQGTIGLEILDELEDVDYVLVPIGGGGLIAGVAAAIKLTNPKVKIIGVEPEGADAMRQSLEAGHVESLDEVQTIAEGVAVRTPGTKAFNILKQYVDRIITVTDVDIMEAFLLLLEREKLIAENAGVLSLAALKYLDEDGQKVTD